MIEVVLILLLTFYCFAQNCEDAKIFCVGRNQEYRYVYQATNKILEEGGYYQTGIPVNASGVTILIEGGSYSHQSVINNIFGTKDNPFKIEPFPNSIVQMKPSPVSEHVFALLEGVDWIEISNGNDGGQFIFETRDTDPRLDGDNDINEIYPIILVDDAHITLGPFEMQSPSDHYIDSYLIGIKKPDTLSHDHFQLLQNIKFSGNFLSAIYIDGDNTEPIRPDISSNKVEIINCEFLQDSNIENLNGSTIHINSGYVSIKNNYFSRNIHSGLNSIKIQSGSFITIENNVFEVNFENYNYKYFVIGISADDFTTQKIIIQNNLFYSLLNSESLIGILEFYSNEVHYGLFNLNVINNIIDGDWGFWDTKENRITNNAQLCTSQCKFNNNIINKNLEIFESSAGNFWEIKDNLIDAYNSGIETYKNEEKPFPYFMQAPNTNRLIGKRYDESPKYDANGYLRSTSFNDDEIIGVGPYEGCGYQSNTSKVNQSLVNKNCECYAGQFLEIETCQFCANTKLIAPECSVCKDPLYNASTGCTVLLDTSSQSNIGLIIFGVIAGVSVVLCIIIVLIVVAVILFVIYKKHSGVFLNVESDWRTADQNKAMSTIKSISKIEQGEEEIAEMIVSQDFFKIKMGDIKVDSKIGSGGFATVFKATYSNMTVAFKCFQTSLFYKQKDQKSNDFEAFESELRLFSALTHNNIPRFFGASLEPPRVGIVMEYCSNGNLKDYLEKNKLKLSERMKLLIGVIKGMIFIHSKNLIHRDLKPDNILLDENNIPKICDFGLSRLDEKSDKKTQAIGTNHFIAPEVFLGNVYDKSSDVFSFAIILYCVIANKFSSLFKGKASSMKNQVNISHNKLRPNLDEIDTSIKQNNQWLIDLMIQCWDHEPNVRPTFAEILEVIEENEIVD